MKKQNIQPVNKENTLGKSFERLIKDVSPCSSYRGLYRLTPHVTSKLYDSLHRCTKNKNIYNVTIEGENYIVIQEKDKVIILGRNEPKKGIIDQRLIPTMIQIIDQSREAILTYLKQETL